MGLLEGFLFGVLGGFMSEFLGLFKLRHKAPDNLPDCVKSFFYWFTTIGMICCGGGLVCAYIYSDVQVNAILSINLGASAPLIIGTFGSQTPKLSPGKSD